MAGRPRKPANEKIDAQIKKYEEELINEQIKLEEKTKKYIDPHKKRIKELTAKIEDLQKEIVNSILKESGLSYEEIRQKLGLNEAAATAEETNANAEQ